MLERILIYKRTHTGDSDAKGCFGIHDCMGSFRARDFDAVIGTRVGAEARANGIAGKSIGLVSALTGDFAGYRTLHLISF